MRVVLFCHSLISDWNHGNAHFLRGVAADLVARGHDVRVYEPHDAWSVVNLLRDAGPSAIADFHAAYPMLDSRRVDSGKLDLDEALDGADVVLVHEWNTHPLVEQIGRHRAAGGRYLLFFHDTHHRSVSDPAAMRSYDLQHYDGVLAFGEVIRERYVTLGWARRAWTWHEAADVERFRPLLAESQGDLVWIGNWGDDERSEEIRQYLIEPVRALGIQAQLYGVRYPADALDQLGSAGIRYGGWLANYRVPHVFAAYRATVHIPRRPYVATLPGIPTIRMFEALACGIPLVSAWWDDAEGLFREDEDYLVARTPAKMQSALSRILHEPEYAASLAASGLETIRRRHTCAHRVDELFNILGSVRDAREERAFTV